MMKKRTKKKKKKVMRNNNFIRRLHQKKGADMTSENAVIQKQKYKFH